MGKYTQSCSIYMLFFIVNTIFSIVYGSVDFIVVSLTSVFIIFLSLHGLIRQDYDNGVIEQVFMYREKIYRFMFGIVLSHWLRHGLVISIFATFLVLHGCQFGTIQVIKMISTLLYLTFTVTAFGMVGESLILHDKDDIKAAIVNFPLIIPVLITSSLLNMCTSCMYVAILVILTLIAAVCAIYVAQVNIRLALSYAL